MRMTATSRRSLEVATHVNIHAWPDGKCFVMAYVYRDGVPQGVCQIQSGDGAMIYPSIAAATRAIARVTDVQVGKIVPVE